MKKMILMSLGLAMGAAFAASSNKPDATGPYKDYYYLQTDYSAVGNNSGSGQRWTIDNGNCEQPQAGHSYYLGPSATFNIYNADFATGGRTFAGDDLVVAGTISHSGGWSYGLVIPKCTFLPGSMFKWTSRSYITTGDWTIKGTADDPVILRHTGTTADFKQQQNWIGDSTAYVRMETPTGSGKVGQKWEIAASWPSFYGTFEIGTANTNYSKVAFTTPGRVMVDAGSSFELRSQSGTSSLGGLEVKDGGSLKLTAEKNTQLVKIEDRLVLEPGSILVHNKEMGGTNTGARTSWPLFDLSAEAYAAGLPDFSKVTLTGVYETQNYNLPRQRLVVTDSENGRKIVSVTSREIIYQTKNDNTFTPNAFIDTTGGSAGQFWTSGTTPSAADAERDFASLGKNLCLYSPNDYQDTYVFPGSSLRHNGAVGNFYPTNIQFKTLYLGGGVQWKFSAFPDRTYDLTFDELNNFEGVMDFRVSGRDTLRLNGPIVSPLSTSTLRLRMITPWGIGSDTWAKANVATYFTGTIELNGDNSGYPGAIEVYCQQATDSTVTNYFMAWGMSPYVPGPSSNVTIRVKNSKSLGGGTTSYTWNKITINNQCRLELAETAAFDDPNRGWYFPGTGYIRVPDGKTATVSTPISFVAATRLVKEGLGTLAFAGTPNIRTTGGTFTIQEGGVQIASADAFKGLPVTVGKNGKLVFDAASPVTLDLTTANTSLAGESGVINVEILDPNTSKSEAAEKLTLFTVPTEQSAALVAALKVRATLKDATRRCRIAAESSGDTTSNIVADYSQQGMMITFR